MAVTFDTARFRIDIKDGGARPAHAFIGEHMFGHLTQGFQSGKFVDDAITATASVPFTMAPEDNVQFGFVQLARAVTWKATYSGRVPAEGSIELDYFAPTVMVTKILLDAGSTPVPPDPFYRQPATVFRSGAPEFKWGDHPGMAVFLQRDNRKASNVPNFLQRVVMDREFATLFTAVVNQSLTRFLAFFEWKLRYEFTLRWVNSAPQIATNTSIVRVTTRPAIGTPPAADWQPMLLSPKGERANSVGGRAQKITDVGTPPNRIDSPAPASGVPAGFWS